MTDNDALVRRTWAEISNAADSPTGKDDEDAFLVGLRDGFEDAVQLIDLLTGGDGEYRYCSDHDPDRHCPSPVEMIHRILAAFRSTPQAQPRDLPAQDEVGAAELCRQTARELRENGDGDCNAAMQAIRWDERAAALDRHRAGDDALREENARLRAEAESIRYIMNLSVEEFEVLAAHALAAVTGGRE